ncbi:hypothetical protein [Pseudomonas paraveronii]|uniref:hypothetical protein n=1 Tax=Pseudomonas paraveronii TaxID=3040598 RepID=UPI002AB04CE8|nr:hypothetical protein [Pseudomonas sp. FLM 11]
MTYGVRTWSANGVLEMDTDSYTYQVLHNAVYTLAMGAVVTANIAGFNPATCTAVILPTQAAANNYCYSAMPFMSVGVGSVVVRSKHPNEPDAIGSTIQFRLLVMRFKN